MTKNEIINELRDLLKDDLRDCNWLNESGYPIYVETKYNTTLEVGEYEFEIIGKVDAKMYYYAGDRMTPPEYDLVKGTFTPSEIHIKYNDDVAPITIDVTELEIKF